MWCVQNVGFVHLNLNTYFLGLSRRLENVRRMMMVMKLVLELSFHLTQRILVVKRYLTLLLRLVNILVLLEMFLMMMIVWLMREKWFWNLLVCICRNSYHAHCCLLQPLSIQSLTLLFPLMLHLVIDLLSLWQLI